jgi:fic family toxin-antitoxin system, toxin component
LVKERGIIEVLNMSISLGKRQLVDSIWKSAGIEGVGTTFPNTEKILENLPVETKRDEVLFIINMKNAWYFLFENIELPNNLMFLRGLNRICMKDLSFDAGNIRTLPVSIGRTYWKPEQSREEVILSELDRIDKISDKMDSAVEMFCFITRTQMFLDGNKRVAQLMCNKILMENDIGILSIPYEKIGQFKELLVNFYESNNQTMLKAF